MEVEIEREEEESRASETEKAKMLQRKRSITKASKARGNQQTTFDSSLCQHNHEDLERVST